MVTDDPEEFETDPRATDPDVWQLTLEDAWSNQPFESPVEITVWARDSYSSMKMVD